MRLWQEGKSMQSPKLSGCAAGLAFLAVVIAVAYAFGRLT